MAPNQWAQRHAARWLTESILCGLSEETGTARPALMPAVEVWGLGFVFFKDFRVCKHEGTLPTKMRLNRCISSGKLLKAPRFLIPSVRFGGRLFGGTMIISGSFGPYHWGLFRLSSSRGLSAPSKQSQLECSTSA